MTDQNPRLARVLDDITSERERQIAKGWTREHDDRHSTHDLVQLAERRLHTPGRPPAEPGYYDRQRLIEGITILVAAVEAWDRRAVES